MRFKKTLNKKQEQQILNLFYRTDLRENEAIIDNTSVTIGKELNIKTNAVDWFLKTHLDKKFEKINNRNEV